MALDDRIATLLRAGDTASRRFHWGSAIVVAVISVSMLILELGWGDHGLTLVMALAFIPASVFVLYRAYQMPGRDVVEDAIAVPERIVVIFSVDTGRIKLLAIKLDDDRRMTLRYNRDDELELVRRALAKAAPKASISPALV